MKPPDRCAGCDQPLEPNDELLCADCVEDGVEAMPDPLDPDFVIVIRGGSDVPSPDGSRTA